MPTWIIIEKDGLPNDENPHIFDGGEHGVVYAKVYKKGKHPSLITWDSSGEEDFEDLKLYYRWLDESPEQVKEVAVAFGEWRRKTPIEVQIQLMAEDTQNIFNVENAFDYWYTNIHPKKG